MELARFLKNISRVSGITLIQKADRYITYINR